MRKRTQSADRLESTGEFYYRDGGGLNAGIFHGRKLYAFWPAGIPVNQGNIHAVVTAILASEDSDLPLGDGAVRVAIAEAERRTAR